MRRPSPRALLRHLWGDLSSLWDGRLWHKWLIYRLWVPVSSLLSGLTNYTRRRYYGQEIRTAYLITGAFPEPTVRGPDLTDGASKWLRENLGIPEVIELKSIHEMDRYSTSMENSLVVMTYDALVPFCRQKLRKQFADSLRLRQLGVQVWPLLPDIYWLRLTFAASVLVSFTGGIAPMIVNSTSEARRFGIPNPSGPHFWTIPDIEQIIGNPIPWKSRECAAIGSKSGDSRRKEILEPLIPGLETAGYRWLWSDSETLEYLDYISLLKFCKIAFVPTFLPKIYFLGPHNYQQKISATMITGRVWETFVAGSALVTEFNKNLEDLGFHADSHYIDLTRFTESSRENTPSDKELEEIANRGRARALTLLREETLPS